MLWPPAAAIKAASLALFWPRMTPKSGQLDSLLERVVILAQTGPPSSSNWTHPESVERFRVEPAGVSPGAMARQDLPPSPPGPPDASASGMGWAQFGRGSGSKLDEDFQARFPACVFPGRTRSPPRKHPARTTRPGGGQPVGQSAFAMIAAIRSRLPPAALRPQGCGRRNAASHDDRIRA